MDGATFTHAPVVLLASSRERHVEGALERHGYTVARVTTGALALAWAADLEPDIIMLDAHLSDMSGIEVSRLLRAEPRIPAHVPVLLILERGRPTAKQRVEAVRAGVWDFVRDPLNLDELTPQFQAYVRAKRNMDGHAGGAADAPPTGIHGRQALARRARELGALTARARAAFASIVFAPGSAPLAALTAEVLVRRARLSDVVGILGPSELAVLAPTTDAAGARQFAIRTSEALRAEVGAATALRIGYHAVANMGYEPTNPLGILARASLATRQGVRDSAHPSIARFDPALEGTVKEQMV